MSAAAACAAVGGSWISISVERARRMMSSARVSAGRGAVVTLVLRLVRRNVRRLHLKDDDDDGMLMKERARKDMWWKRMPFAGGRAQRSAEQCPEEKIDPKLLRIDRLFVLAVLPC